jgi:enoyl-CoA hydratase
VVPQGQVLAKALEVASKVSLGAPVALEKTKEVMVRSSGLPLEEAFAIETQCTKENAAMEDAKEGPRAFMEKRPPVFRGRRSA